MRFPLLLSLLLTLHFSFGQKQTEKTVSTQEALQLLTPLSQQEEILLKNLPVLTLPPGYKNRDLPAVVDNSTQPYMRPVFNQDEYCCGQAAGIAYAFTYEIDRLRNLPANTSQNQYPTHFTWNWLNSGYGYYGVSYLHSFQVVKHCGTPNVADYGGTLSYGGHDRWMSGYNAYYNGMHNRLNNVFQVNAGNPAGLEVIKTWLYDHMEGAAVGGVANFYAQYMSANQQLPPGTPEEGKYVLTTFGGSPNHAMTIVGYHDSICWDYNSDGQYTNDIDINSDGVVDMKDWEIGGFKMVQSYGGVPAWGDNGYAYMMYKTVADELGSGGIWNHSIHIQDVKSDCNPQLTMKVNLKHDRRNTIKVMAGISTDTNSIQPQHILEFPIFNYQGGPLYMQGGNSQEAKKTIEFGLDVSPLLTHIDPGQPAKYFLMVDENDPGNNGTGMLLSYSLMDYTNGLVQIPCPQLNVPLVENGLTRLSIITAINFDKVSIDNTSLPPAVMGQPYSCQMIASGGEAPYRWYLQREYTESLHTETYPAITQNILTPTNNTDGFVSQELDFAFPFYDSTYTSVTVHVDGYLMFDEQLYPYPYFNDDMVLFTITRNISPFMTQALRLYNAYGDHIYYEGDMNSATFRWNASIDGTTQDMDFAVKIYPSGTIEFYYGSLNLSGQTLWIPGISEGDDETYQFTDSYNGTLPPPNQMVRLEPYNYPPEMELTEDGLFHGTPQQPYFNFDITFRVTDNSFINNYKTLQFSSTGILIEDSISSGGDEIVEYGETALISVDITNIEPDSVSNAVMTISTEDSLIIITDSIENLGTLPVGHTISFPDAFAFDILAGIPDGYGINIMTSISGNRETWESNLYYVAHAPELLISDITVADENNRLDPGDTCNLELSVLNDGSIRSDSIVVTLSTSNPYITLNTSEDTIILLEPDSIRKAVFNLIVADDAQVGQSVDFDVAMADAVGLTVADSFSLSIGQTIEDFETGNFIAFTWGFDGNKDWLISELNPYEGYFCARSGKISHDQESSLLLDIYVHEESNISFYKSISCENDQSGCNFDYLAFYVDGQEMGRWDGEVEWSKNAYILDSGYHRLEWKYHKDSTVSSGYDCAMLDYISLPSCSDASPQLAYSHDQINQIMRPFETDTDTLLMENNGDGNIKFEVLVSSIPGNAKNYGSRSIQGSYLECNMEAVHTGQQKTYTLTLYNASNDDEWIRDVIIDFPEGMSVAGATDFIGGSLGDLVYDGSTGSGITGAWHGEDPNGWGVIKGGETAIAQVTATIEPAYEENIELVFEVQGDVYGNEPHIINGSIHIMNLGMVTAWISVDSVNSGVPGSGVLENYVHFNSAGLEDGEYYCELIINEQFRQRKIIPVALLIDQYLDTEEDDLDFAYDLDIIPNPFSENLNINFSLGREMPITLEVVDIKGRIVEKIIEGKYLKEGRYTCSWNGRNSGGPECPAGIYLVRISSDGRHITRKVILSR